MISKLLKYLGGIAKDRWMHFTMGIVIAAAVFALVALLWGFWWGFALSVVAVLAAGIWKEWWDRGHDGCSDVIDFIVDCFGGAVIWSLVLIIKLWVL